MSLLLVKKWWTRTAKRRERLPSRLVAATAQPGISCAATASWMVVSKSTIFATNMGLRLFVGRSIDRKQTSGVSFGI